MNLALEVQKATHTYLSQLSYEMLIMSHLGTLVVL